MGEARGITFTPERQAELVRLVETLPARPARVSIEPAGAGVLVLRYADRSGMRHRIRIGLAGQGDKPGYVLGGLDFAEGSAPPGTDQRSERALCQSIAAQLVERAGDQLCDLLARLEPAVAHTGLTTREGFGTRVFFFEPELLEGEEAVERAVDELSAIDGLIQSVEIFTSSICEQACPFCLFPRVRAGGDPPITQPHVVAATARLLDQMRGRPERPPLIFSGADCLRHPHLAAFLDLFARETVVPIELLGPMTQLADTAIADRVAALPTLAHVNLTLFSADPALHDAQTGVVGAYDRVMAAIRNCRRRGIAVLANTVVLPATVADLPNLAELLAGLEVPLQISPYRPESWWRPTRGEDGRRAEPVLSWRTLPLPALLVRPEDLTAAFARFSPAALENARTSIIPHCWIPDAIRDDLIFGQWERGWGEPPEPCTRCSHQGACGGPNQAFYEAFGDGVLAPL